MALGAALVKIVLFISNLVFALGGLAILGIGIVFLLRITSITDQLEGKLVVSCWLFIVVGSLIFIIAFFGCCGAVVESHCMLTTYTVLLSVIIVIQTALAVYVFWNSVHLQELIATILGPFFNKGMGTSGEGRKDFNKLEIQLSCCGTTGPSSYGQLTIPSSCCGDEAEVCSGAMVFQQGCVQALTDYIKPHLKAVGIVAVAVAAIEIVSVIFGCCLASSIKREF